MLLLAFEAVLVVHTGAAIMTSCDVLILLMSVEALTED